MKRARRSLYPEAGPPHRSWRRHLYVVIFLHDTPAGRSFDIALLLAIFASVGVVVAESVPWIQAKHGESLYAAEWALTLLFTLEYLLRLVCVKRPGVYARSFFGVVDLLTILPTYLSLLLPGAQALIVIRALRLLRVFRVLKLPNYLTEANFLRMALQSARRKITVFVFTVLTIVLIFGALMYLIEGPEHGFTSIPVGMYWAIVTVTTVGYGDISPVTPIGQLVASVLMIMGYGIIAVPTGIVTAELVSMGGKPKSLVATTLRRCPRCNSDGHDEDANYCKLCGERLGEVTQ